MPSLDDLRTAAESAQPFQPSRMKTILVFGASGAVGRFLMPLLAPSYRAIGISRQPASGADRLQGDLTRTDASWPSADAAISVGPLDAFAAWLQRNRDVTLKRVVALSSMSAESKRESVDERERAVAQSLRDSETTILDVGAERNIAVTIFRPTLIYGAGIDKSLAPVARFVKCYHWIPALSGAHGLRQPVHAADLAKACAVVLENSATFGKTYELGGAERLTQHELLRKIRKHYASWSFAVPVPGAVLRLAVRVAGLSASGAGIVARLRVPLVAENGSAEKDFGYAPRAFDPADVLPGEF
jgi:nucleoside-diphosphate-sugar epimerase